ncbi:MAG: hypothetical protein IT429_13680 [Gemmataceae bacterium]|nr:hypothetical protein [Gemmataceae bacterium]
MPLNLSYENDWQYWDATEKVVFTSITTGSNAPPQQSLTVAKALRGQPSFKERAPSNGVYTGSDLTWLLPGALLAGKRPKPGDTIKDQLPGTAQTTYTVLNPQHDQLDDVWQCYTVALSLHYQLKDTCTFWKHNSAATQQDAAGSRVPSFTQDTTVGASGTVDCRFQLVGESPVEGRGKRLHRCEYKVYLAEEVDLTGEWQIRDSSSNVYQVVSYAGRQTIDSLSEVTCERFGDSA